MVINSVAWPLAVSGHAERESSLHLDLPPLSVGAFPVRFAPKNLTEDDVYKYHYSALGLAVEIRRWAGAETTVATCVYVPSHLVDQVGCLLQECRPA